MTEEAQRIAIAEAMPPNLIHFESGMPMLHIGGDNFMVFDPLRDLNACHEAEKVLKGGFKRGEQWLAYVTYLHDATNGKGEQK